MLEQIWNNILELLSQLVIPDWGVLVSLALPIGTVALVVLGLVWTFRRLMTAPPPRRGVQRLSPTTPAGIHMPGPSLAPILAAIGTFLLLLGLVFGGVTIVLGVIALVLTLLYWLAEGLRIYDHDIQTTRTVLPPRAETGPPPGVHMPGPSFRPLLAAIGTALLLLGLVFGGPVLVVGLLALVVGLIGWLADARKEFVKTVEADRTGHLENIPPPRTPSRLFATFGILLVIAVVLQSGVLTPGSANGGTPGSSANPGVSGAPAAGGSAPPAAGSPGAPPPGGPAADVTVEAKDIAFVQTSWTGPAGRPFKLAFDNEDPGTPHNLALKDSTGAEVFKGEIFNGAETRIYDVPSLPAGSYTFVCSVHANMSGTATLQ